MLHHGRRASTLLRPHLPQLNNAPLLKPRLARVDWEIRQEFQRSDDPDRTAPEHDWATARDLSLITIQLYLHDLPAESGGATRFLARPQTKPDVDYQPKAGSVLLFTQELLHEGVVVEEACRKFTMRSEVMYSGHHIGRIINK